MARVRGRDLRQARKDIKGAIASGDTARFQALASARPVAAARIAGRQAVKQVTARKQVGQVGVGAADVKTAKAARRTSVAAAIKQRRAAKQPSPGRKATLS